MTVVVIRVVIGAKIPHTFDYIIARASFVQYFASPVPSVMERVLFLFIFGFAVHCEAVIPYGRIPIPAEYRQPCSIFTTCDLRQEYCDPGVDTCHSCAYDCPSDALDSSSDNRAFCLKHCQVYYEVQRERDLSTHSLPLDVTTVSSSSNRERTSVGEERAEGATTGTVFTRADTSSERGGEFPTYAVIGSVGGVFLTAAGVMFLIYKCKRRTTKESRREVGEESGEVTRELVSELGYPITTTTHGSPQEEHIV